MTRQDELNRLRDRHEAALDFIESLSMTPMNPTLVAADYALNGAWARSYNVDSSDFAELTRAIREMQ